jgi:hypothetical protein
MSSSFTMVDVAARPPLASMAAVQSEFESSPYWALRQICCEARQGKIIVYGTVTSYYLKQLAVATAAKVAGVGCVQIEIDVRSE